MSENAEALINLIREIVREEVARIIPVLPVEPIDERTYSEMEFCTRVGISRALARKLRAAHQLSFYRVNSRTVRYSAKHEREFLESRGKPRRGY